MRKNDNSTLTVHHLQRALPESGLSIKSSNGTAYFQTLLNPVRWQWCIGIDLLRNSVELSKHQRCSVGKGASWKGGRRMPAPSCSTVILPGCTTVVLPQFSPWRFFPWAHTTSIKRRHINVGHLLRLMVVFIFKLPIPVCIQFCTVLFPRLLFL